MKKLLTTLFGKSPWTSIIGYLGVILAVVHESLVSGQTNWEVIAGSVLFALLGRKAADSKKLEGPGGTNPNEPRPGRP